MREEFPVWLNDRFSARLNCRDRWEAQHRPATTRHPFRPKAYASFTDTRWQSFFDYFDINGASSHFEVRHPFFDIRLLRYMLAVPAMPWCRRKMLIRRSMRQALPREVIRRKKTPLAASPDFARVRKSGFPALRPTAALLNYVDPRKMRAAPASEIEMRGLVRPLGLNYWLRHLTITHIEDNLEHEAAYSAGV